MRHAAFALLVAALVSPAVAGFVPGGGNPAADCYGGLDVTGVDGATNRIEFTEGDPCDFACGARSIWRSSGTAGSRTSGSSGREPRRPARRRRTGIRTRSLRLQAAHDPVSVGGRVAAVSAADPKEACVDAAEDFVRRFSEFWTDPSPEKMGALLTPDVTLIQPLSPPMRGLEAAHAEFGKLFAWLPDLRSFIEFRLMATVGGKRLEWPVVDRFVLRGDKAEKRVTYFDAMPLVPELLRSPSAWPGWWRSGAGRPW
jgi:hypothetical protein